MYYVKKAVYKYNELSDKAKQVANEKIFYDNQEYHDYADIVTLAVEAGEAIGIAIDHNKNGSPVIEYDIYGTGLRYAGTYTYKPDALENLKTIGYGSSSEIVKIANVLKAAQKTVDFCFNSKITFFGRCPHSRSMEFENYYEDEDEADITDDAWPAAKSNIEAAIRKFADYIYSEIMAEYEYRNSDKAVAEFFEYSDYQFYENGDMAEVDASDIINDAGITLPESSPANVTKT